MTTVMFISETRFAHTAVEVGGHWYGFKPNLPKFPTETGYVDHSDRSGFILHRVTFTLDDLRVESALARVLGAYSGKWYVGGVRDCVTFVADFAEALSLRIPKRPNFSPDNLVLNLARLNSQPVAAGRP